MNYSFNFRDVFAAQDALLEGLALTLQLTATTIIIGFTIGALIAIISVYGPQWAKTAVRAYIETIRNTPLIVQLFVLFFGLPSIGIKLGIITVATIGLAANLGAYTAEIIRGGIESIPKSLIDAALSLGLTKPQIFRYIISVPALMSVYPSLISQFVLIMLGTSIASQIAAPELFHAGSIVQSRTYRDFEVYTIISLTYLALALVLRGVFALGFRMMAHHR